MAEPRTALAVEVVYALPDRQWRIVLQVDAGTTVAEAIERSGLCGQIPGLQPEPGRVGIFGRPVELHALLRDGDRIELYRPLQCDPKQVRRERAASARRPAR